MARRTTVPVAGSNEVVVMQLPSGRCTIAGCKAAVGIVLDSGRAAEKPRRPRRSQHPPHRRWQTSQYGDSQRALESASRGWTVRPRRSCLCTAICSPGWTSRFSRRRAASPSRHGNYYSLEWRSNWDSSMISILSKPATCSRDRPFGEAFSRVFSSRLRPAQLIWTAVAETGWVFAGLPCLNLATPR